MDGLMDEERKVLFDVPKYVDYLCTLSIITYLKYINVFVCPS